MNLVNAPGTDDAVHFPAEVDTRVVLAIGRLPLWICAGMPPLADVQTMVLHPPALTIVGWIGMRRIQFAPASTLP